MKEPEEELPARLNHRTRREEDRGQRRHLRHRKRLLLSVNGQNAGIEGGGMKTQASRTVGEVILAVKYRKLIVGYEGRTRQLDAHF